MVERDFKGIWIPAFIWLDESLTLQEKVFLVEIDSLDNGEKGCYANNKYFARFFGVTAPRVSQVINSLVDKGFVDSVIIEENGNERRLKTLLKFPKDPLKESLRHSNTSNKPLYSKKGKKIKKQSKKNKKRIMPSMFEDFYALYPRKVGKGNAKVEWDILCSHLNRPMWQEIKRAILAQMKSERWMAGTKHIVAPERWIKNNRWLDEPESMKLFNGNTNNNPSGSRHYTESKGKYREADYTIGEDGIMKRVKKPPVV